MCGWASASGGAGCAIIAFLAACAACPAGPAIRCLALPALILQIGQLLAIFQLLGTPGEPEWPGVSSMPDWSCHFPQWRPRDLAEVRRAFFPSRAGRLPGNQAAGCRSAFRAAQAPCWAWLPGPGPFPAPPQSTLHAVVLQAVPQLDPLGLDLLRQMLHYEPSQRIRCRQALAHPWFDDIR